MRMKLTLMLAAAAIATPVHAEWLKASTRHFVIYSDTSAGEITKLATRLERLDGALRHISGMADTPESAANPVTVYVLDDVSAIRRLSGRANTAGYYVGRASGSVAFAPRETMAFGANAPGAQLVLFHEYAHHFLLSNVSVAYPAWLSEGYAEFASTARVTDEAVEVGTAANHRAYDLAAASGAPLAWMMDPRGGPMRADQVYGQGWLLTHYLLLDRERRGQLQSYLVALNSGVPPLKAATDSFGSLQRLARALNAYMMRRQLSAFLVPIAKLPPVQPDLRALTPGERALINMRITSTNGVTEKSAGPLFERASKAVAAHTGDAVAQGWLAEMAFDAGRDDEAEAAADRALAADPRSMQALLYKAHIGLRRAAKAKSTDAKTWREARSWIIKANRIQNDNAAALLLYYDSFAAEGAKPTAAAVAGLHRALQLAPQDRFLRFRSAAQHLTDGQVAEAKRALRPLAFDPHAGPDNPAAKLMALLDAGQAGPAALAELAKSEEKGSRDVQPASFSRANSARLRSKP